MLNIIRRSQIVGATVIESSTANRLGQVEEVWLDASGRVAYLSGESGYLSLAQIAGVGDKAVSVFHRLAIETPENLRSGYRLPVRSALGTPLGWVDDFLFDWQTGDITAYVLMGNPSTPFIYRSVLLAEDAEADVLDAIIVRKGMKYPLKSEAEGLSGFLSEKSRQVQSLVRTMSDRLHHILTPEDKPEVVRIKIKDVSNELATSGRHDHHALQEATEFLHDQWDSLQHSMSRTSHRATKALNSAWKQLTGTKV
ncbi:MAG: PRC-barrel domain-containing protein [Thermosynechococcaceae cyanobacterium]